MSCEFPNGFRCWNQGFSLIFPLAELRTCTEPWTTAWGAGSSPRRRTGPWGLGIQMNPVFSDWFSWWIFSGWFNDIERMKWCFSIMLSMSLKPTRVAQRTLVHILDISWYISTQKFDFNRYLPLQIPTWSASVARWPKAGRSLSSHRWWQCFQLPGRFPANGRSLTWWITSGRIIWSQRAKKSFGILLTAARKHQSQTSRKKCWATRHMRIATSIWNCIQIQSCL